MSSPRFGVCADRPGWDHVRCDQDYVANWSLWLDVKILVRTLLAMPATQERGDAEAPERICAHEADHLTRTVDAGLLLAPASALAANAAFVFKHRGAVLAPPIPARPPLRGAAISVA